MTAKLKQAWQAPLVRAALVVSFVIPLLYLTFANAKSPVRQHMDACRELGDSGPAKQLGLTCSVHRENARVIYRFFINGEELK